MRFTIKGINDEVSQCSCCGKDGLKRVVWIEDNETGDIRPFGTTCATQPAKAFGIQKREIAKALRVYETTQAEKRQAEFKAALNAAYETAQAEYTGGWFVKTLSTGFAFDVPNDRAALDALYARHVEPVKARFLKSKA